MAAFSDEMLKGLSFQFISARRHRVEPGWEMKTRLLIDNMLFYVLQGNIESKTLDRRIESEKGDLLIFRRGTLMASRETRRAPFEVIILHFQCSLPSGEDFFSAVHPPISLRPSRHSLIDGLIRKMTREETEKAAGWRLSAQLILGTLVFDLLRNFADHFGSGLRPIYSPRVEKGLRFLKEAISGNPTIPEIARAANVSEAQFRRLFLREVGISPLEYLTRLKISAAIEAKTGGGLTWEEIAERLGFSSLYYFYRVFKKVCGSPPGKYLIKGDI